MTSKTFPLIGAGCGLVAFLALGLLPSMLYGGFAGLLLAGGVLGTPVQPTLLARAFVVGGMVLGVTSVASLFAVAGAAVGALVRVVTSGATRAEVQ